MVAAWKDLPVRIVVASVDIASTLESSEHVRQYLVCCRWLCYNLVVGWTLGATEDVSCSGDDNARCSLLESLKLLMSSAFKTETIVTPLALVPKYWPCEGAAVHPSVSKIKTDCLVRFADKPQTLDHLEDNTRRVIADMRPHMLEKVIENWTSRLDYIRASRYSPMPEILFKM
ncbi:hypothetical protein TNCV_2545711 [Trichonephila clavipes]|nr:hypothetical protein TNCV_2545711 [Trichonephila clavipes]